MNEELPKETQALISWLNTYALVGWSLANTNFSIDELIVSSMKDDEIYKGLLEEFRKEKLKVVEEARKEK